MITIVPARAANKKIYFLLVFALFIFRPTYTLAQVSITSAVAVSDAFGTFTTGLSTPTNWVVQGTGVRGTTWNGTAQTTGTNGGWYGNQNMSFLGSSTASAGNATWILQNNTGYTITGFTLSFTARLWKTGSASPTVSLSYSNSSSSTVPPQGTLTSLGVSFSDATANISIGTSLSGSASSLNIPNGNYIFIRFIHTGGNNSDNLGWDDVTFTPVIPNVNIGAVSSAGNIYPSTDNILQSFTINPLFSALTVSNLSVTTGGTYTLTDIQTTPFKLYINTSNSLSGATQIGSAQAAVASGGTVSFTGLSSTIAANTTQYLIVTVNVSSSAVTNNTINIAATSFNNINFSAVPIKLGTDPVPASASKTIYYGALFSNSGSPTATNIGESSTDNTIFGFDITPLGSIDFTSVTITASGTVTSSHMSNFRIVQDVDSSGDYSGGDVIVSGSISFSNSMTFAISNQTGITSHTKYLLIGDVATVAAGNTITASINNNSDITINGDVTSTASYNGYIQTIVDVTVFSTSTDYFRSVKTNGNWNTTSTWQSSADNATWHTATLVPTQATNRVISIQSGTTVTIDSAVKAKRLTIQSGGKLSHTNGIPFTIVDATAAGVTEFTINGTYILKGTMPTINSGAAIVVNSGGVVEADDNTGGQSDDFARLTTVEFKTGAVFYWNTTLAFETDNMTYFNGPNFATNKPIFRVSQPVTVGATTPTIFNSKFESYGSNPQFKNSGSKTFRDGFGGMTISGAQAKVTHATNSGTFYITASDAVIDGTVTINIDNSPSGTNDLQISEGAYVTISGSPTINIGSSGATGSNFAIEGTVKHTGSNPVYLTYGNLIVDGYIDAASTGTFQANNSTGSITNVTVGSNTTNNSDLAGTLTFTTGYNYVNTFTMQRAISNSNAAIVLGSDVSVNKLVLTKGIAATGNHLFTYNKTSTLTLPSSYSDSYICTCNSSGVEITPTGSNGFRINNVSGNTDQMFPVGTNFTSANRMALNMNNSTTDNFTVVVGKGDIGNTPSPRVNRIWYVSEGTAGGSTTTMRLYFTKRNWSAYPFGSAQNDEIEDGFLWTDPHLVQENYSNLFVNVATTGTADVPDYLLSPYLSEIFGRYYYTISSDYAGNKNGINGFTRFSVVNADGIILPVSIVNLKAYQKNNGIQIDWSALNELNMDRYEVERSADGIHFTGISNIIANNSGSQLNNYSVFDSKPLSGNNFYRIKATDKNGKVNYTFIVSVNINGGKINITVQPNPVQNRVLNVQLNNLSTGSYTALLYNSAGQQVLNKNIEHAGGSSGQLIALPPSVKSGAYILKLFSKTAQYTVRVVVP